MCSLACTYVIYVSVTCRCMASKLESKQVRKSKLEWNKVSKTVIKLHNSRSSVLTRDKLPDSLHLQLHTIDGEIFTVKIHDCIFASVQIRLCNYFLTQKYN